MELLVFCVLGGESASFFTKPLGSLVGFNDPLLAPRIWYVTPLTCICNHTVGAVDAARMIER